MGQLFHSLRIGVLLGALAIALTGCRGDADYDEDEPDAGLGQGACQYSCVAQVSACTEPGLIVQGTCPEDEPLCCNPEGEGGQDTGGADTGGGDTYSSGPCQYECLDFMECPMRAVVEEQECDDAGQLCCNL